MSHDLDRVVAVFGAYDPLEDHEDYAFARRLGEALARRGYGVANGGYGGTMEASARGAREGGGFAIGVTCDLWPRPANAWIDRVEHTTSLQERLNRLVELGRAGYVVLQGATGTLLELALVWELMAKGFLQPRPIVCIRPFWQPLVEMMTQQRPAAGRWVHLVDSPAEAAALFPPVNTTLGPGGGLQ